MDRFSSLTAFVRVVDSGGFSAAARRLNMSTTMVSNHVQALEERLGVRLLNRTTRKVSLTEIGKAYYDRATQILADLEQADDIASELQSVPRGTLRIHVATHMVPFVAPVVAQLLSTYPELKIDLRMGEADVDLIEEGYDVALRMTQPRDSSLIVRSLATWRHVLCCSHDYLDKHGRVQKLDELSAHNCGRHLNYPFGDEWRFLDRKGAPASVRISGSFVTNSGEALRKVALEGAAICLMAGFLVQDDLESGRLVRLLPEYRTVELSMNAVYPHRHHLTAKVRTFIDMLVHHSAEQQKLINPYS
ncbi:LysR family transcriptional regulator [Bradyrhizobium sp. 180]|uniref:LysR family transcriptional regulator n=1 Tax=unclassified Bradyrhizobium TaxID=2631580 RepID=UPI001FFB324F|nr:MULTISPECIES: LysR family transcriptional regulator [unclassified Bradyrhizobium]MCK1489496.1 LysR family transcriptional regulator [Bradyrhizobium sp. 180]MCK1526779.1 LysR family transcriptional regulator [Bradyrhizobium sp. 182]MCK1599712.1 LysR family transcriptional regulator [Bradyrhizobium sp. 164]MCK1617075.1 LysR family transcriptional regulator [Bradyrhizobium sp. 159]MCK1647724.1 LysR family transcriptional regulator [Bradyrhizobium sp. 154]